MSKPKMPQKIVGALILLLLLAVWQIVQGEYLMGAVNAALGIALWRASPSSRTILIWFSAFDLCWYPGKLILLILLAVGPSEMNGLVIGTALAALAIPAFLIWVLTHRDTKQWIAARHPDLLIAGLERFPSSM